MNKVKIYAKSILKIVARNLAKLLFIFPVNNSRILFSAFEGRHVSDNPKCIYDFLRKTNPGKFEYIWIYNGEKEKTNLESDVKIVKRQSLKRLYFTATSKIIVENYSPSFLNSTREDQLFIETWHAGGAYKKISAGRPELDIEKKIRYENMNSADIFISSSKVFTEGTILDGYHYKGEILNIGMPRNDIFFDNQYVNKCSIEMREQFDLNQIVVLYAPTFRGDSLHSDKIDKLIDIDRLRNALITKYRKDVSVLVRCHLLDKHKYDFGKDVINVSSYPDMQKLLCASNILITDYSSSIWDFALLGRPCFCYSPDMDEYIKKRGFYTSPEQWPATICSDMEELCEKITNLDEKQCAEQARKYLEISGSYETGHATKLISNRILDYISEDKKHG